MPITNPNSLILFQNYYYFLFHFLYLGYPSCLDLECSYEQTMEHLIREVEAGADFIITQMVFDALDFFKFVTKCKNNNILVPIIPGIFPIQVKANETKNN